MVLRCAELLAPESGSQLHDYLQGLLCLRPFGFDPILNLLSLDDAARAFALALQCPEQGVFNIPGADTLPLSQAIARWGRSEVPVPGPLLGPLYSLRRAVGRTDFRYDLNQSRFHLNATLDGTRAEAVMGYVPKHPLSWPRAQTAS
jgi:UDP-glucose 4-epimerase